jgi:hypothetical protein
MRVENSPPLRARTCIILPDKLRRIDSCVLQNSHHLVCWGQFEAATTESNDLSKKKYVEVNRQLRVENSRLAKTFFDGQDETSIILHRLACWDVSPDATRVENFTLLRDNQSEYMLRWIARCNTNNRLNINQSEYMLRRIDSCNANHLSNNQSEYMLRWIARCNTNNRLNINQSEYMLRRIDSCNANHLSNNQSEYMLRWIARCKTKSSFQQQPIRIYVETNRQLQRESSSRQP